VLAGLVGIFGLNRPLQGAESAAASQGSSSTAVPALGARDPVVTAFALPKGVVLNRRQQAAYENLKKTDEPKMRNAIDQVHQAQGDAAKIKAAKEAKELRFEIRAKIDEVINTPYPQGPDKAGQDSAKSAEGSGYGGWGPQGGTVPYYYPYRPYYTPYYNAYYYPNSSSSGSSSAKTSPQSTTKPTTKPKSAPVASSTTKR
jgi:hypothetical protein